MDAVIVALIQPFWSFNTTIKFISSFHGLVNLVDSYEMKVAALSQIMGRRVFNATALAALSAPALICLFGWDFVSCTSETHRFKESSVKKRDWILGTNTLKRLLSR